MPDIDLRRPVANHNLMVGRAHRPERPEPAGPTLAQVYDLLQSNNALLLAISARLVALEQAQQRLR